MDEFYYLGAAFLAAFAITFAITPFIIQRIRLRGLVGVDLNKLAKPKISEMGGISVLFGFSFSIMFVLGLYGFFDMQAFNLTAILAAFATVVLIGLLGLMDDLIGWKKGIEQWQHALVPIFAALPLMVLPASIAMKSMYFPFLGEVHFGILYALLIVPIAITGASNAVNMLAGFNGLEAGMGILIILTQLIVMLTLPVDHVGRIEVILISAAMLGALIAFLRYNWFPASIFGGDSLTLMIGASAATIAIIGNIEKISLLLFALFFIELVIKARHGLKSECFGIPQKDGTLKPDPRGGSLTHWVMGRGRFTEPQVTEILLSMQGLVCVIVLLMYWFRVFF
ncbi:MAG: glycosyltransferase 4 family protein [Candidatus Diapherotrites archaeon]